jgi:hypothetical protein
MLRPYILPSSPLSHWSGENFYKGCLAISTAVTPFVTLEGSFLAPARDFSEDRGRIF